MDDEHSWSIHDLDNAPEPPANALMDGSGSGLGISPPRMMTTTTAFSTSKTRRHSADSMEPSSPQQQQQQSSQRPKSISLRDRTWSAPSHPLYPTSASNYYNARAAEMASSASYASASQLSPLVARRQTSLPDHRRRSNTVEELGTPSPVLPPKRWSSSGGSSRLDRMMSMHQQGHLSLPVLGDTEFLAMADDGGGVKPHGGESSEGNYNDDDYGKYYGYGDGPAATVTNLEAMQWLGDVAGGGGSGGGRMPDLGSSLASQKGGSDSMIEPNPGITAHQLPPSVSVLAGVGSIATMTRVHQSQESDPVHKQKLRSNTRREQPHEGHYPLEDQLEDSSHNNIDNNNNLDDDEDEDENDFSHSSSVWGEAGSSSPLHEYKRWKIPTLHQIAVCVAMRVYAPCIWIWYGMSWTVGCPKPSVLSVRRPTDRAILARLNILVGVLALFQIAAALGFLILIAAPNLADRTIPTQTESESQAQQTRSRSSSSIWNVTLNLYLIGVEAFVLVVAAALTVRVVRNVNLVGAIRYLWVLLWLLPFQIYFNIGLYDYFRVTGVWLRHYWRDPSLGWFREQFCEPPSTANTLCAVPIGNETQEVQWCLTAYNSTNCTSIRDNAQKLFLVVSILEGIISKPLVRKSRQSNIPAWLSLPIIWCLAFGIVYTYAQTSTWNTNTNTEASGLARSTLSPPFFSSWRPCWDGTYP